MFNNLIFLTASITLLMLFFTYLWTWKSGILTLKLACNAVVVYIYIGVLVLLLLVLENRGEWLFNRFAKPTSIGWIAGYPVFSNYNNVVSGTLIAEYDHGTYKVKLFSEIPTPYSKGCLYLNITDHSGDMIFFKRYTDADDIRTKLLTFGIDINNLSKQ